MLAGAGNGVLLRHTGLARGANHVSCASEVLEDELVALLDLLLKLVGVDLEEADLKAELTIHFLIFTVCKKGVKIRYNKSPLILTLFLES